LGEGAVLDEPSLLLFAHTIAFRARHSQRGSTFSQANRK
jgi:hypothetical protein